METVFGQITIEAVGQERTSHELKRELADALRGEEGVWLEARTLRSPIQLEPAVVVAMVTGGVSVLTSLITAVAAVMSAGKKQKPGTIRIETTRGDQLEFPATTPPEQIREVVAGLEADAPRRILLLNDV